MEPLDVCERTGTAKASDTIRATTGNENSHGLSFRETNRVTAFEFVHIVDPPQGFRTTVNVHGALIDFLSAVKNFF